MPATDTDDPVDPATLPHDSLKKDVIVCSVICFAIAAIFVGLRFYTRTRIVKVLAASDWFLLAAVVRISSHVAVSTVRPNPPRIQIGSGLQSAFFIRG